MNPPPAAWPGIQEARGANRGRQHTNRNYVQIVNPTSERAVKLKLAYQWVEAGRAEWVVYRAKIRLIESHDANKADAAERQVSTAAGYDGIKSGFDWRGGQSGGATVMMTQRGPSS